MLVAAVCMAASVCSKCGYEVADGLAQCAHCQHRVAAAGPQESTPAPATPTTPAPSKSSPMVAIVSADIAQAKQYYRAGEVALARLYCQNALAVNYLTPPDDARKARAEQIRTYIEACAPEAAALNRPCSVCQGKGRISSSGGGLGSSTGFGGRSCRSCGGSGKVAGRETAEEVMMRLGGAARRFRDAQQSQLRVRVGRVWVPQQQVATLTQRQQAELKRAWPPGCEKCGELGRRDCRDCEGFGTEECPGKGCENGSVKRRKSGGLSGERTERMVKCTVCGGSSRVICSRCKGSGDTICQECQGSGEAPACRRCAGAGIAVCRRCKSTGIYRGESCATCQGAGDEVCGSCGGFGRKP